MESEARILLDDAVACCRRDNVDNRLVTMLDRAEALGLDDTTLTIAAPSRFAGSYLERNRELIEGYLEEAAFAPVMLAVVEPTGAAPQSPAGGNRGSVSTSGTVGASAAPQPVTPPTPQPMGEAAAAADRHTLPAPTIPRASEKDPSTVTVTNTLSPEAFRRMMSEMRGGASGNTAAGRAAIPGPATAHGAGYGRAGSGTAAPSTASPRPLASPIDSKFTFANFVYGDENKHAYHSAQRFAAFADEPGQCTSLFIYGGSGLGKTHLLLAIKNYLAENKPHIKVKYANSQAYIDDFINEIARQKTEGRAILREYHEANVLIIDDIQNIIGKQASIEYFFSLMDEFIRENKKIVIASDRAPKKLGMDERLTSRFNAGMLCLVSEPGFEMKYTILKRYYENAIRGGGDVSTMNVDASLLDALQVHEGTLTDEQLRHMADISGNNIRELESFCERCAGMSFEREQAGQEFTAADIEKIADEYFDTVHKVIHIDTVQAVVEEFYHVSHEELIGPKRSKDIAFARHVAVYLANTMCDLSSSAIGAEFGGRDHSTVLNSLKVVESKMKEDRRICDDLQQLRNKITLKS